MGAVNSLNSVSGAAVEEHKKTPEEAVVVVDMGTADEEGVVEVESLVGHNVVAVAVVVVVDGGGGDNWKWDAIEDC